MTVDLYQNPLRFGVAYDELSADGVTPRPHWNHLMESLRTLGPEELERRWSRAERRIRENGITGLNSSAIFSAVSTATTPGDARAADVSIRPMRA